MESMGMIERVARAICALEYQDPDELTNAIPDGPLYPVWKDFEKFARAAIEAMRVPTKNMVGVGTEARWQSAVRDANSINEIWSAMIDAAINEGEKTE